MKCKFCNQKTTTGNSFGRDEFIVCDSCFNRITEASKLPHWNVLQVILHCGELIHDLNEEKGSE